MSLFSSFDRIDLAFERFAAATPARRALTFDDTELTYAELAQRVHAVAGRLVRAGVGGNGLVAVLLDRSIELVVAILAISRCNAAYLPLDRSLPQRRMQQILRDSACQALVTTGGMQELLGPCGATRIFQIDEKDPLIATDLADITPSEGDALAYCIYTSGSTGTPKGVLNRRAGLDNRIEWMRDAYRLGSADIVLQKTPCTFDVSVWEFFLPFACGGELVVAKPDGHRDPAYLCDLIQKRRVTVAHFVPTMLRSFLVQREVARCTSLQHVFCSGEALAPDTVARFFETFNHCRLHNLYGPTEASIDVTAYECRPLDAMRKRIPIGRAIRGLKVDVRDSKTCRPVGNGDTGEICISGIGVAIGYLGQPALTAERFVQGPANAAGRFYRTGDLGRVLPSGDIDILGRIDLQVKVNGNRIELEEIERCLRGLAGVVDCGVFVDYSSDDLARLVACVVGDPAGAIDESRVLAYAAEHLAAHAVPHRVVFVDELPLGRSGKLARDRLAECAQLERACAVAVTALEEVIARLWEETFPGVRSRHTSFHALGGTSLAAIRLCVLIEEQTGLRMTVADLLAHPTLDGLSRHLGQRSRRADGDPLALPSFI